MSWNEVPLLARGGAAAVVIAIWIAISFGFSRTAQAGDHAAEMIGFRSPSGNIHCLYDRGFQGPPDMPASVRCDMREIDGPPPAAPQDCDGEWGRSFSIAHGEAAGELICTGDAVFSDAYPVLNYGATWQEDGFTCTSEEAGVTCFNEKMHGFKISRGSRNVF